MKSINVIFASYLVIGFENSTILLKLVGRNFKKIMQYDFPIINAFELSQQNHLCLVTSTAINIIDLTTAALINSFNPNTQAAIACITMSAIIAGSTLFCAYSNNELIRCEIIDGKVSSDPSIFREQTAGCFSAITASQQLIATASWFENNVILQSPQGDGALSPRFTVEIPQN